MKTSSALSSQVVLALLLSFVSAVEAAEFSVRNGAELQAALLVSMDNAEPDVIVLSAGRYFIEATPGGEWPRRAQFTYVSSESLTIMGAPGTSARDVILDGFNYGHVLEIYGRDMWTGSAMGELNIIGITAQNGHGTYEAGGISIETGVHDVTIRDCIIRNNFSSAGFGGGVFVRTMNSLVFENNIVTNNRLTERMLTHSLDEPLHPECFGAGAYLHALRPAVIIRNNTIADNSALEHESCTGGGLWIDAGCHTSIDIINNTIYRNQVAGATGGMFVSVVFSTMNFYNNLIYGNSGSGITHDLALLRTDDSIARAYNNNFSTRIGSRFSEEGGNINVDPRLITDGRGGYRLSSESPLIDQGASSVGSIGIPASDYEGERRPCGSAPDIGSDEYCGEGRGAPRPVIRTAKANAPAAKNKNQKKLQPLVPAKPKK